LACHLTRHLTRQQQRLVEVLQGKVLGEVCYVTNDCYVGAGAALLAWLPFAGRRLGLVGTQHGNHLQNAEVQAHVSLSVVHCILRCLYMLCLTLPCAEVSHVACTSTHMQTIQAKHGTKQVLREM
jgi:hypothetical protein